MCIYYDVNVCRCYWLLFVSEVMQYIYCSYDKHTKQNGYLYLQISQIIKDQDPSTCYMHISDKVQLICITSTSYLEKCKRSYPYNRGSLYALFCGKMISRADIFCKLSKIKIKEICIFLIYVDMIFKTSIFILKTVGLEELYLQ